jgi:hypothetical protein
MLTRCLTGLVILHLTQARLLNLATLNGIILNKALTTSLGIVKCGLPVCLSSRDHLVVSRVITATSSLLISLADGTVNKEVQHIGGAAEV